MTSSVDARPSPLPVQDSPAPSRRTTVLLLVLVALAVASRWAGVWKPLLPDEAGFGLVGRTWQPGDEDLYGDYFVDRSPILVTVFKLANLIGGPYFLRLVAAVGLALTIWWVACLARHLVAMVAPERRPDLAMLVVAATATGLLTSADLDPYSAKGELLSVPLLMAGALLAVKALREQRVWWAFFSGVLGMLAVGMKQSLAGALVFAFLLLLAATVTRQVERTVGWRLLGALVAGSVVVVLLTVLGTVAMGGSLSSLAYAVIGFRGDASAYMKVHQVDGESIRAARLWSTFWTTGMAVVVIFVLTRMVTMFRRVPVLATAAVGAALFDTFGVVAGGAYWQAYLYPIALSLTWVLAVAMTVPPRNRWWAGLPAVVAVGLLVVSAITMVRWTDDWKGRVAEVVSAGRAIGEASQPGDTVIQYGGRPELQWASGLDSPYRHPWNLPMRVMDPELKELIAVLDSDQAPTWLALWMTPQEWGGLGTLLEPVVEKNYRLVALSCEGHQILLRNDLTRPDPKPKCEPGWPYLLWTPTEK